MKIKNIVVLILCIIIPVAVGSISGIATNSGLSDWYVALNKPSFNPPNFVFAPVWTALYTLMGISLFLIWQSPRNRARNHALIIFGIQLFLNFTWSFLFFYWQNPALAFIEIIMICFAILFMIILFYRINKWAAFLQIPYFLWVSFASVLNAAIWQLN